MAKGIQLYCKCDRCGEFFEADPKRRYCGRSCRDKANYDRFGRDKYKKKKEVKKLLGGSV